MPKNPQTFRLAGMSQAQHDSAAFTLIERHNEFDDVTRMITPSHRSWSSSISGVRYAFIDFGSDGPGSRPTTIKFS